jgi:hypothetical protein
VSHKNMDYIHSNLSKTNFERIVCVSVEFQSNLAFGRYRRESLKTKKVLSNQTNSVAGVEGSEGAEWSNFYRSFILFYCVRYLGRFYVRDQPRLRACHEIIF